MLTPTLFIVLCTTPVGLQLELSAPTQVKVGARVRTVLEQRLREEGFPVTAGARLKLTVEERSGALRLSATVDGERLEQEFKPEAGEWKDELSLELAQRLTQLAREAIESRADAAAPNAPLVPQPAPQPVLPVEPTAPELLAAPPPAAPPPAPAFHVSASVRLGAMVRVPDVDATMSLAASLAGPVVEPLVLMGVVAARSPALTAWQTPIAVGARVPFHFGAWHLVPEALVGVRLHSWVPSALDGGGTQVDLTGLFGLSVLRSLGPFKVGLRLGLDVAPARQHLLGEDVVWSRGTFGFSTQLHFER